MFSPRHRDFYGVRTVGVLVLAAGLILSRCFQVSSAPAHTLQIPEPALHTTGFSQLPDTSLQSFVTAYTAAIPRQNTEGLTPPADSELPAFNAAVKALLEGDLIDAEGLAQTHNYELVQLFDQTFQQTYYILHEKQASARGLGVYVVSLQFQRNVVVEVPHPLADADTQTEGRRVFQELRARGLFIAGTHRCANAAQSSCSGGTTACNDMNDTVERPYRVSDAGHFATTFFQAAHKATLQLSSPAVTIALHGNRSEPAEVTLSNGTSEKVENATTALTNGLRSALRSRGVDAASCNSDADRNRGLSFCGRETVQGRLSNGSPEPCNTFATSASGLFLHIEQHDDQSIRQNPAKLIDALTAVIPEVGAGTVLQFSAAGYSFSEGAGNATITVTRAGNTSGMSTVAYATVDDPATVRCDDTVTNHGAAYARCDYATSIDTLTFAPGETQKTINIPLINDSHVEGAEVVQLRLSNPQGAMIGAQATTTLTITDNDAPGQPNPIFGDEFFVRQHYLDFLNREPEPSGLADWLRCMRTRPDCDRVLVSQSFFGSQEFQLKGYFIYRFYKLAFNRLPQYTEITPDMRGITGQTPNDVFQKKAAFTKTLAQRSEFVNTYGGQTNAQYVALLMGRYGLTQITTPDPANPDGVVQPDGSVQVTKITLTSAQLTAQLDAGTLVRTQVLRAIADSDQVFNLEFTQAFVAMQYYGYLRRTPETAGYNAWLNYLNTHPGDFRTMVNGFMNSQEYCLRFGTAQ